MSKFLLIFAATSGSVAVVLGAFAAHGLKHRIDENLLSAFQTGVTYQFYHTLVLLFLALAIKQFPEVNFNISAYFFIAGILFFSGSLYLLALTGLKLFGPITPLGGLMFIIGWLTLLWAVIKAQN